MDNADSTLPKAIKIIAWLWIAGAIWKLSATYSSWPLFEMWRNLFLIVIKFSLLSSGILLLRGLRQGPTIYFAVTALNTAVFYLYPPDLPGIEKYFSPGAIGLAIIAPLIFLSLIGYNWKHLRW